MGRCVPPIYFLVKRFSRYRFNEFTCVYIIIVISHHSRIKQPNRLLPILVNFRKLHRYKPAKTQIRKDLRSTIKYWYYTNYITTTNGKTNLLIQHNSINLVELRVSFICDISRVLTVVHNGNRKKRQMKKIMQLCNMSK